MPFDNQVKVVPGIATIQHSASFTRFHQPKSPVLKIITRCLNHQREVVLGLYFDADDSLMRILLLSPTSWMFLCSAIQISADILDGLFDTEGTIE